MSDFQNAPMREEVGGVSAAIEEVEDSIELAPISMEISQAVEAEAVEAEVSEDSITYRLIELAQELESHLSINFLQYSKSNKLVEELIDLYMDLKRAAQQFHTQCQRRYQFCISLTDYKNLAGEAEKKISMLLQIRATFADLFTQQVNESECRSKDEDETVVMVG